MDNKIISQYEEYAQKIGDRTGLYKAVSDYFNIKSAIYPGSHIDIAPSFVIAEVVYIDSFKGAIKFFKDMNSIQEYIEKKKQYDIECKISFYGIDYHEAIHIEPVDLIISQYAGFVGQVTKSLLKDGGILLCNDSHGDATLARFDEDYEFIGIVDSQNTIREDNLDQYFKLFKGKEIDINQVREKMKGPKYQNSASNYLFKLKSK